MIERILHVKTLTAFVACVTQSTGEKILATLENQQKRNDIKDY
jgi:hypothetical protein